VFSVVEQEPEYPGGEEAMYKFLSDNLVYPKAAREKGIQGKVIVEFVVEKNGKISNVKAVKSVSPELDAEAIRVVSKMPKWKPGVQRGEKVRSRWRLPIHFQLH
ncbi:MAG: energy transducer TonB, partial [Bacteroidales bacterium]|nr:energy transducer TonB [Bacteroidales bacterium]